MLDSTNKKSSEHLVSVLMPAYNAEKYIKQAIDSILNQTHAQIELLIADDKSKDRTRKIIDGYADNRIKRFHQNKNLGYLKTCNNLFEKANGDFITFQDADDYSNLNRIEKQLEIFNKDENLGACGTNYIRVTDHGKELSCSRLYTEYEKIREAVPDFHMVGASIMIKREVYENIGGYHEYFDRMGAEDYYWAWLIFEKYKYINLKEPLYAYRFNPNSLSGNMSDNYHKMFSSDIVHFLVNQRQMTGTDSLESGELENLDKFVEEKSKPYKEDSSLLFRELAKRAFWNFEYNKAKRYAKKAVLKKPLSKENLIIGYVMIKFFTKKNIPKPIYHILSYLITKYYKLNREQYRVDKWKKAGRPNPPPHSIKLKTIREYISTEKVFIETGTYKGDMIEKVRKLFNEVHSIELDVALYENAVKRFLKFSHIKVWQGDSSSTLPTILKNINQPVVFWLDGHYSEGITAKGSKDTPIIEELNAIEKHSKDKLLQHLILIDDANAFTGNNDYPSKFELTKMLDEKGMHFLAEKNNIFIIKCN